MVNSTTAQIFLHDTRTIAFKALAFIEDGINYYANRNDAKESIVLQRRDKLADIANYITQLEETIKLQNEELQERYNEGYRAGRAQAIKERPEPPTMDTSRTHLGQACRGWLNQLERKR